MAVILAPLAVLLAASAGSIAKRALAAIGFGLVSVVGFEVVKADIKAGILSNLDGLSGAAAQLLALMGLWDVVGIWLGAITTVLSLMALKRLALMRS